MTTTRKRTLPGRVTVAEDRYLELVRACPLRPIRSEAELDRAIAMVDRLTDRPEGDLSPAEADYLDVLSSLIAAYEQRRYPMGEVSGAEMVRYLMELRGLDQAAVATGSGLPPSTLSEALSGRRQLNIRHIQALAGFFRVDPGLFIARR